MPFEVNLVAALKYLDYYQQQDTQASKPKMDNDGPIVAKSFFDLNTQRSGIDSTVKDHLKYEKGTGRPKIPIRW